MPRSDAYDFPKPAERRVVVLDRAKALVTITNTAAESGLYQFRVLGGLIGPIGKLRATLLGRVTDTSVVLNGLENLVFRCKFGPTTLTTLSLPTRTDGGTVNKGIGSDLPLKLVLELANLGLPASQGAEAALDSVGVSDSVSASVIYAGVASDAAFVRQCHVIDRGNSTVDTNTASPLSITAQWPAAQAAKSLTMYSLVLELL